jgi:PAS domain S-box-containing protein
MKNSEKTKESLKTELEGLQKRVAELETSEKQFEMLAEHSPNMIFVNKKGKILYVNKKCENIMGFTKDEFYADEFNFMDLIAPEYKDVVRRNFQLHLSGKEIPPYEYKLITKIGGEIIAIHTTKLIDYKGGKAILGIVTDITERVKMEKDLKQRREELEQF